MDCVPSVGDNIPHTDVLLGNKRAGVDGVVVKATALVHDDFVSCGVAVGKERNLRERSVVV